jgi:hypothetical protein
MFHVKHTPHILLINPWITDFAAYNLWVRPLGLLSIGTLLREYGFRVTLIDCLDLPGKSKTFGDGKFHKTKIEKPLPLKSIPRNYSRYGIPVESLFEKLSFLEEPDLIAVTSGMTYWYPGVFKAVEILKEFFKGVPILLGGIYASLCYDHAFQRSGADYVYKGSDEQEILKLVGKVTGFEPLTPYGRLINRPYDTYPSFDLYSHLDYVCLATTRGCPFRCTYCAAPILTEGFVRRDPFQVVDEIDYWTSKYEVRNIALYDDALLIDPPEHIIPILEEVTRRGIRCNFHAPNALHVRGKEMELKEKKEVKKEAGEGTRPGPVFIPAVDILENQQELIVLADMPGVESKDIEIDLKDNQLIITGKVNPVEAEKEASLYREFNWGTTSVSSHFRISSIRVRSPLRSRRASSG